MLDSGHLGEIQLMLTHSFRLVQDAPHDWRVRTAGYEYRINDADGRELAAWHWHPAPFPGPDFPHLHIAAASLGHTHLPTGRVSIESVLRLLIDDLKVPSRRTD
jgi:hypothetical protein